MRRGEERGRKPNKQSPGTISHLGAARASKERTFPLGGDHRRAEMKQEARSNLFVVAGTRVFFFFLLSFPPPPLRLKGRNGRAEKMKRRNGTNTRRPS